VSVWVRSPLTADRCHSARDYVDFQLSFLITRCARWPGKTGGANRFSLIFWFFCIKAKERKKAHRVGVKSQDKKEEINPEGWGLNCIKAKERKKAL
jgi:hypothetical protein